MNRCRACGHEQKNHHGCGCVVYVRGRYPSALCICKRFLP